MKYYYALLLHYAFLLVFVSVNAKHIKIQKDVFEACNGKKQNVNILIRLKSMVEDAPIQALSTEGIFSRKTKSISELVENLRNRTKAIQQPILDILHGKQTISILDTLSSNKSMNHKKFEYSSFWSENIIAVKSPTQEILKKIAKNPNVESIRVEQTLYLDPVQSKSKSKRPVAETTPGRAEWGIENVRAPNVWKLGKKGKGIRVGSIDTGVRGTHEALKNNFLGDYGWYDAFQEYDEPYDDVGHGTHTVGLMVGENGIGVAPQAKWMSCRACSRAKGCPETALLKCAQFMACPSDPKGKKKDCSKAPHVINCSWGGGQNNDFFASSIAAWKSVGIIPIFASGNTGNDGCGTITSPADYDDVIAIGATDQQNNLAPFSSSGPTTKNLLKPDFVAPGVDMLSASFLGDNSYTSMSGTSMASPVYAGIVALVLNNHGERMAFNSLRSLLRSHSYRTLPLRKLTCANETSKAFPNNIYGYGKADASLATVVELKSLRVG